MVANRIDKQKRANLRVTFLLLCLLPTCLQIWWIAEPLVSRVLTSGKTVAKEKDELTDTSSQPNVQIVTETRTEHVEVPPKINWLSEQGIEQDSTQHGGLAVVRKKDLPPTHWLQRFAFETLQVQEFENRVVLSIDQMKLPVEDLNWAHQQFLQGNLDKVLQRREKPLRLQVRSLTLTKLNNQLEQAITLRHVHVEFANSIAGFQAFATGQSGNDLFKEFRCQSIRTMAEGKLVDLTELETNGLPIWVADQNLAQTTGASAMFSGKLTWQEFNANGSVDESTQGVSQVDITGELHSVDCATLTASFASDQRPVAHGSCSIQVSEYRRIKDRLTSFRGELVGSSGAVSPRIVSLIGNGVKWVGSMDSNDVRKFRSFLFLVDYTNDRLNVRSRYPQGQQLIWSEVADILIANP